ncbi:unnamed protein product, partial [Mycena citricolor]
CCWIPGLVEFIRKLSLVSEMIGRAGMHSRIRVFGRGGLRHTGLWGCWSPNESRGSTRLTRFPHWEPTCMHQPVTPRRLSSAAFVPVGATVTKHVPWMRSETGGHHFPLVFRTEGFETLGNFSQAVGGI